MIKYLPLPAHFMAALYMLKRRGKPGGYFTMFIMANQL